jgi:hypothetical protein
LIHKQTNLLFIHYTAMNRPQESEYAQSPYTSRYINLVTGNDVVGQLREGMNEVTVLFTSLTPEQLHYRYAPEKWSLLELLRHMVDTERIMSYRALCIARGEKQALPGFDENVYARHAATTIGSFADVLKEYQLIREANLLLFSSLNEEALSQTGNANGKDISARAILFVIAGHEQHHLQVIREKYLGNE